MADITKQDYIQTQQQIICFATIVADMPLAEFLGKINTCESLSPILDPTLFRQGQDNLQLIKELASGLQKFQKVVIKIKTQMPI